MQIFSARLMRASCLRMRLEGRALASFFCERELNIRRFGRKYIFVVVIIYPKDNQSQAHLCCASPRQALVECGTVLVQMDTSVTIVWLVLACMGFLLSYNAYGDAGAAILGIGIFFGVGIASFFSPHADPSKRATAQRH